MYFNNLLNKEKVMKERKYINLVGLGSSSPKVKKAKKAKRRKSRATRGAGRGVARSSK